MFISFAYVVLIASTFSVIHGKYQFFHARNFIDVETVVYCTRLIAKRLFNPEKRIDVIYSNPIGDLENVITRAFIKSSPMLIADRAKQTKNSRIPCYIVIEHDQFDNSRRTFLFGKSDLRTLQYLFVSKAEREQVHLFARDLLHNGYLDAAFLMFDDRTIGTIIRAKATGKEITLSSVGSCTPLTTDVDRISAFAENSRQFCLLGGCTMKYGIVTDATVSFWRKEDTLKLKRNETLQTVGGLIVENFGKLYNLSIDSSAGISVP
ncbi:hypothetical protein ANTPLA_LOCUS5612 [Anthophora plagiata]